MAVLKIKTEMKCKICSSEHADTINAMIEKNARDKGKAGGYNQDKLIDEAQRNLGIKLTKDNLGIHGKKHIRLTDDSDEQYQHQMSMQMGGRALELATKEFGEGWEDRVLTNDEMLTFVRIAAQHDMILRMQAGEKTGVTVDQGLKAVDSGTRRRSSESEDAMRKGIGMALQAHFTQKALPSGDLPIIEHEPVDADDDS